MQGEITGCSFTAQNFQREEMERFAEVLSALGVKIKCEITKSGKTARVEVSDLPSVYDAKVKRTRNAGRTSKGTRPPAGSIFNSDTTCAEFLEWAESHTTEEAMRELGLARSTYFRRLKTMKERVEWERVNNPQRVKRGMAELHHTLGNLS